MNPHNGHMSGDKARRRYGLGAAVAAVVLLAACPVLAQGWWPWSNHETEDRPPIPQEPVYQSEQPPPPAAPPAANWSTKNPICLQLEQRLVQESQRNNQSRDALPRLEDEIRQVQQSSQATQSELERRSCYEYFLFSKTLRRTRACVDLSKQAEQAKLRLSQLETQRQQIIGSSEQSYRDDIVRELARNNCGANYVQEARRQQSHGIFSSIWQDEEGGSYDNNWTPRGGPLSSATYRTVCVRLCDGYYFPVSFSTLPSHFEQDENVCQSKCAAPVELYYYQNPGATVDQSVALHTQEPYTTLKTAFRYRKELVPGCSCKQAEYVPQSKPGQAPTGDATPPSGKRAEGDAGGWQARSETEARQR